jgi:hypothetical protein
LGEIDCRCHVHKHVNESDTYQKIIDSIVEDYVKAIQINQTNCPLKIRIGIFNVVPPVERYNTVENPAFPYLGTDEERRSYVLYFNQCLKEKCQENGYVFFDVYTSYADERGFLRKDLSDGNVHIRDGTYLTEFIQDQIDVIAKKFKLSDAKAQIKLLQDKQPSLRFVQKSHIADLIYFLCSDSASEITGANIPIDGGWTSQ